RRRFRAGAYKISETAPQPTRAILSQISPTCECVRSFTRSLMADCSALANASPRYRRLSFPYGNRCLWAQGNHSAAVGFSKIPTASNRIKIRDFEHDRCGNVVIQTEVRDGGREINAVASGRESQWFEGNSDFVAAFR